MNTFLSIPPKAPVGPLSAPNDLPTTLLAYIDEHFPDAHPESFRGDADQLARLRKKWVEGAIHGATGAGNDGAGAGGVATIEVHKDVLDGLLEYHAQLAFLLSKFPSNINLQFSYAAPFPPPPYSLSKDTTTSLPSLNYERACVLFNIAAVLAGLGSSEKRDQSEGLKRALSHLQNAAGVISYIRGDILPSLISESAHFASSSSPAGSLAAGYDLTSEFLTVLEHIMMAQAQECFWRRAVIEKYKNGIVARLAVKVSEYYDEALSAMEEGLPKVSQFFPNSWKTHLNVKKWHFLAAANYRMSQEDLEKSKYGDEIARLKVAESAAKKALDLAGSNSQGTVVTDLKTMAATIASNLTRATRDNDLVYLSPIPAGNDLPKIVPAPMVKPTLLDEVQNSFDWVLKRGGALFTGLVPYGVHVALSIYEDRKENLIRVKFAGHQEEMDGLIATTLQSLGLPGAITALDRPTGLPPSLLQKSEEVFQGGGCQQVETSLAAVQRLSQRVSSALDEVFDILDQEANEDDRRQQDERLAAALPPSHVANAELISRGDQYRQTLQQARRSDAEVRRKWEESKPLVEILSDGETALGKYIPSSHKQTDFSTQSHPEVRRIQGLLEDLEDLRTQRGRLVAEAKRMAARDDVRTAVIQQSTSAGSSVRPEIFEDLFEKELSKYKRLELEEEDMERKQSNLLEDLRVANEAFTKQKQEDSRTRFREKKLQDMELAYWKWREVLGNCEEGQRFYNDFLNLLSQYKDAARQWVRGRWQETENLLAQFNAMSMQSQNHVPSPDTTSRPKAPSSANAPATLRPILPPPPSLPSAPTFSLPPPNSATWQSAMDYLPPPPPGSQSTSSRTRSATGPNEHASTPAPRPPRKKGGAIV